MANWDELNEELDSTLDAMTQEDWNEWKNKTQKNSILNWDLHQKLMNKRNEIIVCVGIGLNMFFPEYITIGSLPEVKKELVESIKKIKKNGKI
jgi:trans-2-enoyl-CoA reductase